MLRRGHIPQQTSCHTHTHTHCVYYKAMKTLVNIDTHTHFDLGWTKTIRYFTNSWPPPLLPSSNPFILSHSSSLLLFIYFLSSYTLARTRVLFLSTWYFAFHSCFSSLCPKYLSPGGAISSPPSRLYSTQCVITQAGTYCPSLCAFIKANLAGHSPEVHSLPSPIEMFSFVRNDKNVLLWYSGEDLFTL